MTMTEQVKIPVDEQVANAINWIEALCDNDIGRAGGVMKDEKGHCCCLGVAREICRTGGQARAWADPGELSGSTGAIGLKKRANKESFPRSAELILASYNDEGNIEHMDSDKSVMPLDPELIHPFIGLELARNPERFFMPAVAAGVREHFGW